jgi:hypothetical protein
MQDTNAITAGVLRALVAGTVVAAFISIALLPAAGIFEQPVTLSLLVALAAAVGSRSVHIPYLKMQVTASDIFVFCALVAIAPMAAPLVALASVVGAVLGRGRRPFSIRTVFNLGAVPLSMAAAVFLFLGAGGEAGNPTGSILPLLVAAIVYPLFNMALAATAIRLETGRSWFSICKQSISCVLVSSLSSALLGAGLLLVLIEIGPLGLILGVVPALPIAAYLRSHLKRAARYVSRRERSDEPARLSAIGNA